MTKSVAVLALLTVTLFTACRRTDFTEAAVPSAATTLALTTQQAADTTYVDVTLGGGAPAALGSFTGEVTHAASWRFAQCDAQQPQALLACKAHGETVRMAAAWAGGTHAGALVRLTFVRTTTTATPSFQIIVSEAHGARCDDLLDSIEVRRQSVAAAGAR
jgi:hypothetical protein